MSAEPCQKGGLGLCLTHAQGNGHGAHLVEEDGLCHVGREEAGRELRRLEVPDDGLDLLAGLRVRGPLTALTAVQALVSDALAALDDIRNPERSRNVRRCLVAALALCAGVPRGRRRRKR